MRKVAIIGLGVSGLGVLKALSRHADRLKNIEIVAFDTSDSLGRGEPFRQDVDDALLNSPSDTISIDYQEMGDFQSWLATKGFAEVAYYPRWLYGAYQVDRLQDLKQRLPLRLVEDPVVRIQASGSKWLLTCQSGQRDLYDWIHLASGSLPSLDPYGFQEKERYLGAAYPLEDLLKQLPDRGTIGVLGTGLSGVDVIKAIGHAKPHLELLVYSPSGMFPTARVNWDQAFEFSILTQAALESHLGDQGKEWKYFYQLWQEEWQARGYHWEEWDQTHLLPGLDGLALSLEAQPSLAFAQALALHVTIILTKIWPKWGEESQKALLKRLGHAIKNLRNPMPPQSAREIIFLSDQGRLGILWGNQQVQAWEEGFTIGETKVEYLVNAMGQGLKEENKDQAPPVLRSLLDQGLVSLHPLGGLRLDPETGLALDTNGKPVPGLYLHGLLVNGNIYQNNSTVKIQERAQKVIEAWLEKESL